MLMQQSAMPTAGHLPGLALSGLHYVGRGFAAQQLIEEWNARRALSAKVLSESLERRKSNWAASRSMMQATSNTSLWSLRQHLFSSPG